MSNRIMLTLVNDLQEIQKKYQNDGELWYSLETLLVRAKNDTYSDMLGVALPKTALHDDLMHMKKWVPELELVIQRNMKGDYDDTCVQESSCRW